MTLERIWYVRCDQPGCGRTFESSQRTKRTLIRRVRDLGWLVGADRAHALCPIHNPRPKSPPGPRATTPPPKMLGT